jgi:hypothetical protein
MREIPLTQGRFAIVDDEDYERVMAVGPWWLFSHRYAACRIDGEIITMHRFLLGLSKGDAQQVDHINGNKLDNRRCNLRLCTNAENQRNRGPNRNNKTGYKGVSFNKFAGKYQAEIMVNRHPIYLGVFNTVEEAAHAYGIAARFYFGEFAWKEA